MKIDTVCLFYLRQLELHLEELAADARARERLRGGARRAVVPPDGVCQRPGAKAPWYFNDAPRRHFLVGQITICSKRPKYYIKRLKSSILFPRHIILLVQYIVSLTTISVY